MTKLDAPILGNQNISFYLKSTPEEAQEVFFIFSAKYFNDGIKEGEEEFIADQTYNEFTLIELADIPIGVDSLQLTIISGAINGADDGCYQYTKSWVDNIEISNRTTQISTITKNGLNIYPNPSSGLFNISQSSNEYKRYRILDILGKELKSGTLEHSSFRLTKKGPYILQLYSEDNSSRDIVRKIMVL